MNRIAILTTFPINSLIHEIAIQLQLQGAMIEFLTPSTLPERTMHDLIINRVKTNEVLSWAIARKRDGAIILPDPEVVRVVKDRVSCRHLFHQHGIQMPEAIFGTPLDLLYFPAEQRLPLVLKRRWVHKVPVRVVYTPGKLKQVLLEYDLAEELVAEKLLTGEHVTAYFIEDFLFAFRKPPLVDDSEEFELDMGSLPADVAANLTRYRHATGLSFGKLDFVIQPTNEVFVVDAGLFPKFRHIPEAAALLSNAFSRVAELNKSLCASLASP